VTYLDYTLKYQSKEECIVKSLVKKIAIYSMIGMMQVGFGASVIEASPLHNGSVSVQLQSDRHDRDQDRHERERVENERHEREMRRHPNEGEREWHERQQRENERHEENLRRIAHDILDLILDN
jgi:membrane protein involved in colicin uptake